MSQDGKILRVRAYSDIQVLDPSFRKSAPEDDIMRNIFVGLVTNKPGTEWGWELDGAASINQVDDQHIEFVLREGLVIDFPLATKVIPDRFCKSLDGFIGARHLTIEYTYTVQEVQEKFGEITGGRLVEGFGMTESSPVTHANPVFGQRKAGSIGVLGVSLAFGLSLLVIGLPELISQLGGFLEGYVPSPRVVWFAEIGGWQKTNVLDRTKLRSGNVIAGPAAGRIWETPLASLASRPDRADPASDRFHLRLHVHGPGRAGDRAAGVGRGGRVPAAAGP